MLYTKWDELDETQMRAFYNERVVYRDETLKARILSNGLFARMYTPQIVVQGVRAARAQRAMDALSRGGEEEEDGEDGTLGRRRGNDEESEDGDFVIKRKTSN